MSLTNTINYDNSGNFVFDPNKVEFVGSLAQLKLIDNTGQTFNQPFTNDTGFTYDAAKSEFSAGQLQRIDQAPTDSTCWATYTTDQNLNASINGGSLTGVLTGATVASGKLDCKGGTVKYCTYSATNNVGSANQTGSLFIQYKPNYSGTPVSTRVIILISDTGVNNNAINIQHRSDGEIQYAILDSTGTLIFNVGLGVWNPNAGVEYNFFITWDITTGSSKLYIDEIQFGSTQTATGTRTQPQTIIIGTNFNGTSTSDAEFDNLVLFDNIVAVSDYSSLAESRYLGSLTTYPVMTYPGIGIIQAFTNIVATQTGVNKFNINGQYYSSGWISSDDSYAQMNTIAEILAQIATLPVADTVTFKMRTEDSNTQISINDLTLTYTGQIYSTDDPDIITISHIDADALVSFTEVSATKPAGTDIKYILNVSGQDMYWSGIAWVNSDGTFAQSNTAAEINTNASSLDISQGVALKIRVLLNSDGTDTPTIATISFSYDFFITRPIPNECIVYGWLNDVAADVESVTVRGFTFSPFFHTENIIAVDKQVVSAVNGLFEIPLVETETVDEVLNIEITYLLIDGSTKVFTYSNLTIPDKVSESLENIVEG